MYGNLSQTVVLKIPKLFQVLSHLSSSKFKKIRYREMPMLDTFSQIKRVNSNINHRYFRLNDHFKENTPYKYLNFNNNKRYISPITKIGKSYSVQNFISSCYPKIGGKGQVNNNTETVINKFNISNISNMSKNNKTTVCENNMNSYLKNLNDNTSNNNENNEKNEENCNNNSNKENEDDEETKINKYMNMINSKKPQNVNELKELLEMNYMKYMAKNDSNGVVFPKIKRVFRAISQDDLFMKTLDKKIESLSNIRPSVKCSIYGRKRNIILKKDFDLCQKYFKNIAVPIKCTIRTNPFNKN